MAGRDAEGTGGVDRLGRTRQDDKQRKLMLEDKEGEKRVTFKTGEIKERKEEWEKMRKELKDLIRAEVKLAEGDRKNLREEIERLKAQVNKYKERIKNLEGEGRVGRTEEGGSEGGTEEEEVRSRYSGKSRVNSCVSISALSGMSRLSEREVERIRRLVTEKDREERSNIVIKGIRLPKELGKEKKEGREWATGLIKENNQANYTRSNGEKENKR